MGRLVFLFIVVVLAVVFVNWLLKEDPKKVAAALRRGALWVGVAAVVVLAVMSRNWIFAAVAAALPFIGRALSLLRYVPILSQLYSHYQNAQAAKAYRGGGAGGPQTSQVQSRFLRMTLEHDTGNMDGEVVAGEHQGRRLSELDLDQLKALLEHYRERDGESFALLEAYLDRVYEDWRDAESRQGAAEFSAGPMGIQEAREVLGVTDEAGEEEIVQAHRRLMQKMHPDRGGSTYLAAKINQAKDVLLAKDN